MQTISFLESMSLPCVLPSNCAAKHALPRLCASRSHGIRRMCSSSLREHRVLRSRRSYDASQGNARRDGYDASCINVYVRSRIGNDFLGRKNVPSPPTNPRVRGGNNTAQPSSTHGRRMGDVGGIGCAQQEYFEEDSGVYSGDRDPVQIPFVSPCFCSALLHALPPEIVVE